MLFSSVMTIVSWWDLMRSQDYSFKSWSSQTYMIIHRFSRIYIKD